MGKQPGRAAGQTPVRARDCMMAPRKLPRNASRPPTLPPHACRKSDIDRDRNASEDAPAAVPQLPLELPPQSDVAGAPFGTSLQRFPRPARMAATSSVTLICINGDDNQNPARRCLRPGPEPFGRGANTVGMESAQLYVANKFNPYKANLCNDPVVPGERAWLWIGRRT